MLKSFLIAAAALFINSLSAYAQDDEALKKLAQTRYKLAQQVWEDYLKTCAPEYGFTFIEPTCFQSIRLLEAQLDVANDKKARETAYRQHYDRMVVVDVAIRKRWTNYYSPRQRDDARLERYITKSQLVVTEAAYWWEREKQGKSDVRPNRFLKPEQPEPKDK